ncbi:uncharacterized protein LOC126803220 [Argentina anserina]|uniref:uncharacterized protein LOC126803220 n=1 Tax=Argentina anserina TaxID=57926 RepID=UPI0021764D75|nr:uncharacterized protein LOC126803220 [Potentilla anserina]
MSDHDRQAKKAKVFSTWYKKKDSAQLIERNRPNSSAPLASDKHQHVTSPIIQPRDFVPIGVTGLASDTDIESVPIVESAIPETRENVPTFDSTSTEFTPTPRPLACNVNSTMINEQPDVISETLEDTYFDVGDLERDPGKRKQIYEYPINQRDRIRRAYINLGPYHHKLFEYPRVRSGNQYRRFNYSWFQYWPWLEYSHSKNKVFCFPCFLFAKGPKVNPALTTDGFSDWKRVRDGKNCVFLNHIGGPCSLHNSCVKCVADLMKAPQHVDIILNRQSRDEILKNRLRLKTTIESVRYLAYQGCAFRAQDESLGSKNRGNCVELIKHTAKFSPEVAKVVLENAPKNATYTSPTIQKEILNILANKVRMHIRGEVGDSRFCILVDEAQDSAHKEQMAIILRFVDKEGFLTERFFDIVMVEDTTAETLHQEISKVLLHHNLQVERLRGQGYDGASNMRGEWNGLQALFMRDCSYAYYVHCFAHQLQLVLVAASKKVDPIWKFFSSLSSIVNVICASPKRHTEFHVAQVMHITELVIAGERGTGRGLNQIGTLHRPGATRWGSHFTSVCDLIDKYDATCTVLEFIMDDKTTESLRAEADGAYNAIRSFQFIFILHLLKKMMGLTDILCQKLQQKSQDILNAMNLVEITVNSLHKLREDGWEDFLEKVVSFCRKHDIDIPDMDGQFNMSSRRHNCQQRNITTEHHYRVDLFYAAIDFELVELNGRFNERTKELLILSSSLDPADGFKAFNLDNICKLAEKFYPRDFSKQELHRLRSELTIYESDVPHDDVLKNVTTLAELCQGLFETKKSMTYQMIDRLIRLVLTLPISTATTERSFSAMKRIKTMLRNKMENDFLADNMIVHIEKELAENYDADSIITEFASIQERRVQFD